MSESKTEKEPKERTRGRSRERRESAESAESDGSDVIDLCDNPHYQVLSAVFETEKGENVAEILSKIRKDIHLLTVTIRQLIQLSLDAQANKSDSDSGSERED